MKFVGNGDLKSSSLSPAVTELAAPRQRQVQVQNFPLVKRSASFKCETHPWWVFRCLFRPLETAALWFSLNLLECIHTVCCNKGMSSQIFFPLPSLLSHYWLNNTKSETSWSCLPPGAVAASCFQSPGFLRGVIFWTVWFTTWNKCLANVQLPNHNVTLINTVLKIFGPGGARACTLGRTWNQVDCSSCAVLQRLSVDGMLEHTPWKC